MKFQYEITQEAIDKKWSETGERENRHQTAIIPDEALTLEQRTASLKLSDICKEFGIRQALGFHIGELIVKRNKFARVGVSVSVDSHDHILTNDEILATMIDMVENAETTREEYNKMCDEVAHEREQEAIEREERRKREQELIRAEREKREQEKREKREQAAMIEWDASGKAVLDLQDRLFVVSGDTQDHRWNSWCKTVTAVTETNDNGYDFAGEFINDGTVEIDRKYTVYLVASTNGSRKYRTTTYRVIVLNEESGNLDVTDIATDNDKPGWALRIRDQVKALLA